MILTRAHDQFHPEGALATEGPRSMSTVRLRDPSGRTAPLGMTIVAAVVLLLVTPAPAAESWHFKRQFLPPLVKGVPKILDSQDTKTGRFGTGIWIVTDQNPMYSLAVAWSTRIEGV